ncbi:MAG: porin [Proteobacteria bacterium]|nr:porin [Pseudomonadota bacterium]
MPVDPPVGDVGDGGKKHKKGDKGDKGDQGDKASTETAHPDVDPDGVDAAEPTEADEPTAADPEQPGKHDKKKAKKAKKAKKKKHGKLEFGGRLLAREAFVRLKDAPHVVAQGTLNSARVKSEYSWHEVRAELEVELATKVRVKNAFAQLRLADVTTKVDVRAGNFKIPFSGIQLTSLWSFPMADRGLVDNVLVHRLQVAGRAVGGMMVVGWPVAWSPELRVGMFQGTDDAGNALAVRGRDRFGQDGVVRMTVKPTHGLELGLAGEARVGQLQEVAAPIERGYAGELDVTLNTAAGPGQLRVWAEGMLGTSWLVAGNNPGHTHATFGEGRGIAAWRLGGAGHGKRYVELYGLFGMVDPDTAIQHDLVVEATGGLTYGAWNSWRLQLELERWQTGSNAPIGIVELGLAPTTSTTLLVQLGARL